MAHHARRLIPSRPCRLSLVLAFAWFLFASLGGGAAAQSQNPRLELLLRKGQNALDAGDFAGAVSAFEEAQQLSPENLAVNRGLVLSYVQDSRLADATDVG